MDDEIPVEAMNDVLELIYSGQKIAAIKRYRELKGQELDEMPSLLDAKKFVEELTDELRSKYPERFKHSEPSGCSAAIIVLAVAVGGCWWISDWMS